MIRRKNIGFVCEHGGHLTEMQIIIDGLDIDKYFIITNYSQRTINLHCKNYLLSPNGNVLLKIFRNFIYINKIFKIEKPDILISTGAEIAIPAFILGKLIYNTNNIFIESCCRINSKSKTGTILYYFSDLFIVQWEETIKKYGLKAKYLGGGLI